MLPVDLGIAIEFHAILADFPQRSRLQGVQQLSTSNVVLSCLALLQDVVGQCTAHEYDVRDDGGEQL